MLWTIFICVAFLHAEVGASVPGMFDVTDYGARGDGKADDTAAIQHAMDAAANNTMWVDPSDGQKMGEVHGDSIMSQATVFFPSGVYHITKSTSAAASNTALFLPLPC